jgi:Phage protein Gp138 N-terminal domain
MEDPRQYLNDQEEGMRLAMEGKQAGVWTAMPAIVTSVNLEKMTLDATIAIQGRYENPDGSISWVNIQPIQDVPICFPSGGGFTITMPIAVDDEVLLVFAARCIDAWWQSGGTGNLPMEYRMHDLSDGFAIPGPKSIPKTISGISATDLQIRNNAGTTYLSITAAGKIGFTNAATSLKTILSNLNTAVSTFATACSSATSVGQIATAGGVLATALATVTTEIGALLV